ncbi:MAG: hypothetical protein KDC80_02480 [Saprospiraceae bacterium]|nr:hypothetical protein [Saprospiraceae bacterium]
MISFKFNWAYQFYSDHGLEEIGNILNISGQWQWQFRDSYIYGNYLSTRPSDDLHVRIHEYPLPFGKEQEESGFTALIQIKADSDLEKSEVDRVFRELLNLIEATEIQEIEPYD